MATFVWHIMFDDVYYMMCIIYIYDIWCILYIYIFDILYILYDVYYMMCIV